MSMTIEVDGMEYGSDFRLVRTYALRLARKCFLQHFCPEDHPVLSTELHLVEMARSKLQEHILAKIPIRDLPRIRPVMEAQIRMIAKTQVLAYVDSEDDREKMIQAVEEESLEDVFPAVH